MAPVSLIVPRVKYDPDPRSPLRRTMLMFRLAAICGIGLPLAAPPLSTDYTQHRSLRVEIESTLEMETTSFEMMIDGEPRGGGGRGGQASEEARVITFIDSVLADDEGRPTEVRREFETVEQETARDMVDEASGPLDGVTVLFTSDEDGEVEAEVEDGSVDDDTILKGHRLELAFDAFLPEGKMEEEDSWDLDSDMILRALGLDLEASWFPRPESGGWEGGERGGRRGGGYRGSSSFNLLVEADWEGTATLISLDEDYEGMECALIAVELEASGEREERSWGGRGDHGDAFGLAIASLFPVESTYDIELEGRLLFSIKERRPVLFEIEGDVTTERNIERSTERGDFSMSSTQEGSFSYTATLTLEESEKE